MTDETKQETVAGQRIMSIEQQMQQSLSPERIKSERQALVATRESFERHQHAKIGIAQRCAQGPMTHDKMQECFEITERNSDENHQRARARAITATRVARLIPPRTFSAPTSIQATSEPEAEQHSQSGGGHRKMPSPLPELRNINSSENLLHVLELERQTLQVGLEPIALENDILKFYIHDINDAFFKALYALQNNELQAFVKHLTHFFIYLNRYCAIGYDVDNQEYDNTLKYERIKKLASQKITELLLYVAEQPSTFKLLRKASQTDAAQALLKVAQTHINIPSWVLIADLIKNVFNSIELINAELICLVIEGNQSTTHAKKIIELAANYEQEHHARADDWSCLNVNTFFPREQLQAQLAETVLHAQHESKTDEQVQDDSSSSRPASSELETVDLEETLHTGEVKETLLENNARRFIVSATHIINDKKRLQELLDSAQKQKILDIENNVYAPLDLSSPFTLYEVLRDKFRVFPGKARELNIDIYSSHAIAIFVDYIRESIPEQHWHTLGMFFEYGYFDIPESFIRSEFQLGHDVSDEQIRFTKKAFTHMGIAIRKLCNDENIQASKGELETSGLSDYLLLKKIKIDVDAHENNNRAIGFFHRKNNDGLSNLRAALSTIGNSFGNKTTTIADVAARAGRTMESSITKRPRFLRSDSVHEKYQQWQQRLSIFTRPEPEEPVFQIRGSDVVPDNGNSADRPLSV